MSHIIASDQTASCSHRTAPALYHPIIDSAQIPRPLTRTSIAMFRSHRTPAGGGLFLFMDDAKRQARASGRHVIDLSVGASDLPAPPEALQTLQDAILDPNTHSCEYHGHPGPQHALM